MAGPAGEKKSAFFLFFSVLLLVFCSASPLRALPASSSPTRSFSDELFAHFHQQPGPQPPTAPAQMPRKKTLRLDVTGARLSCAEDDCSHHRGCSLEIAYRVSSGGTGDLDVETQVICQVRLDYTTSHGYALQSKRCSPPATHTLHHPGRIDSTVVVEFQFSPYEQVVDAQVGSINCSLEKTEVLHRAAGN